MQPTPHRILRICLRVALFCFLTALPRNAWCEEEKEDRFLITNGTVAMPESLSLKSCEVYTRSARVSFVQPADSSLDIDRPNHRIRIYPLARGYTITLNFKNSDPIYLTKAYADELRVQVEARFPGAKITSDSTIATGASPGRYFDIEQVTAFKTRLTTRLVFLALPDGVLEVSLTAAPANFPGQGRNFACFLNSLSVKSAK